MVALANTVEPEFQTVSASILYRVPMVLFALE